MLDDVCFVFSPVVLSEQLYFGLYLLILSFKKKIK